MSSKPEPNGVTTSYDLADALRTLADKLTSAEPFSISSKPRLYLYQWDKPNFVAAAKVIGGEKGGDHLFFTITNSCRALNIDISINREAVCRLVTPAREAVYECDPLLSQAEEAEIGGAR